jgi:hypothetical protein
VDRGARWRPPVRPADAFLPRIPEAEHFDAMSSRSNAIVDVILDNREEDAARRDPRRGVSERPRRREQRPDRAGYVMAEARDAIA